jgi:DNA-binding LytR/AlgR family response regulator
MKKYNCLVVEDEPLAAEILTDYIAQVPFLHCVGVCRDSIYALQVLQREKIDVMFLDIHLPKMKGLDFVRTLQNPPQVIITTAYRDYALEGYEVNAVDYLVKPVSFPRFLTAVNKLRQGIPLAPPGPEASNELPYLLININKKKIRVPVEEILYIESKKDYIDIVTAAKVYTTKYQLGEIAQELGADTFIRIHRSYIAARHKITAYSATRAELGVVLLPIGRAYRDRVLQILGK